MMMKFLTGAAALALAASVAHADPGGGKGGGGNGHAGRVEAGPGSGGGKSHGDGGGKKHDARGGGHAERAMAQGNPGGHGKDRPDKAERGDHRLANGSDKTREIRSDKSERAARREDRRDSGHDTRFVDDDHRARDGDRRFAWHDIDRRGLVEGCPPGLAKKHNGCRPPGQARKDWAYLDRPDWWGLRGLDDGRYSYYDGSLIRLGGDGRILSYLPLLGGALAPGNVWPSFYEPVALPDYYQDYYGLGPVSNYRYYDDTLYHVDPQTSAITSIAALLTGDQFGIGQRLPDGYDVYNVPYGYRDRYVDGPDSDYRYSDGYVYQVDPETRLIAAVIELLT